MGATILTVLLAAQPPTGFTASLERIPLVRLPSRPGEPPGVEVEPFRSLVRLRGYALAPGAKSDLCPRSERAHDGLRLRCTTRLLWAELGSERRGTYLEVRRLRGAPWTWRHEALPRLPWAFSDMGIPDQCPGRLSASRGECALAQGRDEEAREAYRRALPTTDAALAQVRLGDLALAEGRVEEALDWFTRVRHGGGIGRLAAERACELMGSCVLESEARPFSTYGLGGTMRLEAQLRRLRREALFGSLRRAVGFIAEASAQGEELCARAVGLCQAVVLGALEGDDSEAALDALAAFTLPELRGGALDFELAASAADVAERSGAPVFAAKVLSTVTERVPPVLAAAHLHRIVRLYVEGGDGVRAAVVAEYAESRLGAAALRRGEWPATLRAIAALRAPPSARAEAASSARSSGARAIPALADDVNLAVELAKVASLRSRSTAAHLQEKRRHE